MALFGKKEKQGEAQQELDILVTTTDSISKPYEEIGLVTFTSTKRSVDSVSNPDLIAAELTKKALAKGADAIIGFRYNLRTNGVNGTEEIGYGTAVKFK